MAAEVYPERLLCDTSFVGVIGARRAHPERFHHWSAEILDRIDASILAISVISLAEARYGYLKAGWGEKRIGEEERRLSGFLQIPLSAQDLDEWARIRHACKTEGFSMSDNDLWIASTAITRAYPLVTCDTDHERLGRATALEVILLPPPVRP